MGKSFEEMSVTELKDKLRDKNLPVSGNKSQLIARLRTKIPANVVDKELYNRVREKVKRVSIWPSAYASGQVVSEYKKAGGRYKGKKGGNLDRWYKEEWVNVCKKSGRSFAKCGRKKSNVREYPYCRPRVRVNSKTPMTVVELRKKYGSKKFDELCKKKRTRGLPKDGRAQSISKK